MSDILFSSWGGRIIDNRGKESEAFESADHVTLPEYFKQDEKIKALMGWDGIILRSSDIDILDLCREYLEAVYEHSKTCDKCNYCATGWKEQLEVFEDLYNGEATEEDLEFLQSSAEAVVDAGKCTIGKACPTPVLQTLKYFADDYQQVLSGEKKVSTGTYYSKLTAPCMDACPIHLDIPKYIEKIKDAKFADSLGVIRERLPLPSIVGRVCFRPCEKHCRRGIVDEPISIKSLKRFVADQEMASDGEPEYPITPSEKTGKVAVVGAGPAGITCAHHLARRGHQVAIYEQLGEPGGMSAVGIPDYRLPRHILQREVEQVEKMGVAIHYNQTVGKDITLSQLEQDFDAVFVGIGAQESTSMGIEGEDEGHEGFIPGLKYLREVNEGKNPYPDGKKVVVIGGGNVAIDCVRSALRLDNEEVHLLYRRTRNEMPADDVEIHDAEEENVTFHFLATPIRVLVEDGKVIGLECIQMKLGEPDESGRCRPVPVEGSEFVFDCDLVIPAIGQRVDLSLFEGVQDVQTTSKNTILVDDVTKQSNRIAIFSAGDCETGPDALITACAGGLKAAENIDRFINNQPLEYSDDDHFEGILNSLKVFDPDEEIKKVEPIERKQPPILPPETRISGFNEVEQGFSSPEAVAEAERCLRCYYVATVAV